MGQINSLSRYAKETTDERNWNYPTSPPPPLKLHRYFLTKFAHTERNLTFFLKSFKKIWKCSRCTYENFPISLNCLLLSTHTETFAIYPTLSLLTHAKSERDMARLLSGRRAVILVKSDDAWLLFISSNCILRTHSLYPALPASSDNYF